MSGNVLVNTTVVLLSFHVIPLNKTLDALFDELRVRRELDAEDLGALGDQSVVLDRHPRLHHFHNCRIHDVLTVILNSCREVCLFGISLGFRVHERDFDLDEVVMVCHIDREKIIHLELFSSGCFVKDLTLTKRNQMRLQLCISQLQLLQ